ncbi:rano class II histocompatibility antigen, A beta chain [Megalobrama amblycephala]|uniref:rano class II histocompatibility antigen, A beta chain n=1 Tax=Megalobrama amblycephala TaxID=75352 RepID=UPI00201436E9|nr:rano class II histocompatibility antigen, A beta chain [Megalobrama amblycephala]
MAAITGFTVVSESSATPTVKVEPTASRAKSRNSMNDPRGPWGAVTLTKADKVHCRIHAGTRTPNKAAESCPCMQHTVFKVTTTHSSRTSQMQDNLVVHLAVFLYTLFKAVQGNYGYVEILCRVPDTQQNTEFIFSITYSMIEYLRYNSTEDKAVGFTEFGEKLAEEYNNNAILRAQPEFVLNQCKKIGDVILNLGLTVPPEVIIRLDREANGNQKAVLVCSAYDFYPKPIKLTWMRDDKEMTADVTSTEELDDGDWYYQIHSHLE